MTTQSKLDTPWRDCELLTLLQASAIAGISRASLYNYAAAGKLEFRNLAGRTLVTTASLGKLIDGAEPWIPSKRGAAARKLRSAPRGL